MRRVFLVLAGIVAFCCATERAWADEPSSAGDAAGSSAAGASSAVEAALADMKAGAFEQACPALKKAYREDARSSTIFHIAKCYDGWGRIATAAVHYDDYLAAYDRLTPLEQKAARDLEEEASSRRQVLEARIPKVVLRVPNDAPGSTRVLRQAEGGVPVQLAIGIPLPIDPGEHVLTTEIPGRAPAFTKFLLKEGENRIVHVQIPETSEKGNPTRAVEPIQPVPSMMPALDPGISGRRVAAYTLGGIGAVGILGGLVAGVITWAQKEPIEKNCLADRPKVCNAQGVAAKATAEITGMVSNVALPVGLAALGTGVVLYLTEPPPSKFGGAGPSLNVGVGVGTVEVVGQW